MTYVEGFVAAVPTANKEAYLKHATEFAPLIIEFGATRHVEAWGDDVKRGHTTDFFMACDAKDDETPVFSWFEYPDKATRDAANAKMMSDPRMKEMGANMPFDGKRMIYGGFAPVVESGSFDGAGYVDGFVLPVKAEKKDAYFEMADTAAPIFREHGAMQDVEAWGDDVPKGEVTDFFRAIKGQASEVPVFSWIAWTDRAARDAGWERVMADERMKPPADMPFDGKRMFWGGFEVILDHSSAGARAPQAIEA